MGVLAVVGLSSSAGVGTSGGGGGSTVPTKIERRWRGSPATATRPEGPAGTARTVTAVPAAAGERAPAKRSPKAYVSCVEQATDTAALEKCQAFLP